MHAALKDRRLLDPSEAGMLGRVYNVRADVSIVAPEHLDSNTLVVDRVMPLEVGQSIIKRDLKGGPLSAHNQFSPSIVTMALESTLTTKTSSEGGSAEEAILQGVLQFGSGSGSQGAQPSNFEVGSLLLDGRIIFDINTGVMISFPGAFFQLDFLYTAGVAGGFITAGAPVGPSYQVTYSLGYEPQVHQGAVQMTQFAPDVNIPASPAVGSSVQFFRPKYSTEIFFTWSNWQNAGFTPLNVAFNNMQGLTVWSLVYPNTSLPPQRLPWPADAVEVVVTNVSAGTMNLFRAISILEF